MTCRRLHRQRPRRPAPLAVLTGARGRVSPCCGGRTSRWSRRSSATCPFSKHLHIATAFPNILLPQARAARRAAEARPRGRGRDVRSQDAPGPRLEGPARRLHLHRMRPLPAGLPGLEHREAAQSQALHHGHPAHVDRRRAGDRHHPELADRPGHVRPRRHRRRRPRPSPRRSSTTPSRTTRSGIASPAARVSRRVRCSSSTSTRSSGCVGTSCSRRAGSRRS